MPGVLNGKVALVTGGSSGIGRATALNFAREGAKVVIADIQVEKGEAAIAEIRQAGGEGTFLKTDVSKWAEVEALVAAIVAQYETLDCAFNNAGVEGPLFKSTADFPIGEWDRILAVDLTGVFFCMKAELAVMATRKRGVIVNMSSIAGVIGDVMIGAAYHASKFGVIGLTKTAALEYASAGIRVNAVAPGFIDTPMVRDFFRERPELEKVITAAEPMGRIGTADEVASLVTWLCSDGASFVTGSTYPVDGGLLAK